MPELPEVETIRRDLEREFAGKRIKTVEVDRAPGRSAATASTADFVGRPKAGEVESVVRRGKYLLSNLDSGDVLVVHLGMSGQLLRANAEDPSQATPTWSSTSGRAPSCASSIPGPSGSCSSPARSARREVPELAHLGFDPLDDR